MSQVEESQIAVEATQAEVEVPVDAIEVPEETSENPKKRPSSAAAATKEANAKKSKKNDVASKVKAVTKALALAQKRGVSASVIELMASMLEPSLSQEHGFQTEVQEMIAKVLSEAELALEADVAAAQELVSGGDAEREKREANVATTEAAYAASQEESKAKDAAKNAAAETLKVAGLAMKDAVAKQVAGDRDAVAIEKTKATVEEAVKLLTTLKETGAGKRQLQALLKHLAPVGLESTLEKSLPLPLAKKPEARGSFDLIVLEHVDKTIADKVVELMAKLNEAAPAREARAATVEAAKATLDAAVKANEEAIDASKAAKDAEAEAAAASNTAKAAVKSLTTELLNASSTLEKAKAALDAFRSEPLAAFAELRTLPAVAANEV
jgi:hypothetical protein